MSEVLREEIGEGSPGAFIQVWHVTPPAEHRGFRVLREEWHGGGGDALSGEERHIFEWKYANEG